MTGIELRFSGTGWDHPTCNGLNNRAIVCVKSILALDTKINLWAP